MSDDKTEAGAPLLSIVSMSLQSVEYVQTCFSIYDYFHVKSCDLDTKVKVLKSTRVHFLKVFVSRPGVKLLHFFGLKKRSRLKTKTKTSFVGKVMGN